MALDLERFAFSFSHAIIKLQDVQFTGIKHIGFKQDIHREATYGTSRKPQKRSAGQLGLGEGTLMFSDLEEAMQFYNALGDDPTLTLFSVDCTLTNEAGQTRSFECLSCCLSAFEGDFEAGAEALSLNLPFDFLLLKIDGREFARS
jgi:hypothetical protein